MWNRDLGFSSFSEYAFEEKKKLLGSQVGLG
jgi:hypothetical protein